VDAPRARIHAALEEPQSVPTGSGERDADRPETHDINARPPARAGSNTATANGDVRVAEPIRLEPPIPCGENLATISRQLLADLDATFDARRAARGKSASALWAEERVQLLPVPATSFEVRKPIPVEISSRAMVRIEGAYPRAGPLGAVTFLTFPGSL
jgi:hypothetical protein